MKDSDDGDAQEGWSAEGAEWFDNLPWDDALYLLTRQDDDVVDEADELRLGRLRESYQEATGYEWD